MSTHYNSLTLETYVYGNFASVYIHNYVSGDRTGIVSGTACTYYRNIIDASKYDYIGDIITKVYGVDSVVIYDLRDDK